MPKHSYTVKPQYSLRTLSQMFFSFLCKEIMNYGYANVEGKASLQTHNFKNILSYLEKFTTASVV
jgi:hypothetical protein